MAIVPNTLAAGATIVASELNQNFSALETAITGNLTEASLSSSTRIPNSKLENDDFELLVHLQATWATVAPPVASGTVPFVMVAIPNLASTTDYTCNGGGYFISDSGDASSTTFDVRWGRYSAGAWSTTSTPVSTVTVAASTNQALTGNITSSSTLTSDATNQRFLGLFITQVGTNALNTGTATLPAVLSVTLKLKRALRS